MTGSNSTCTWDLIQKLAFNVLKETITVLVLISLDTSTIFYIKADSLDFMTGVVLSKVFKEDSK